MLAGLTLRSFTWADGSEVREATMSCSYSFSQCWVQFPSGQKSQQKPLRSGSVQSHVQRWWKMLLAGDRNKAPWNRLTPFIKENAWPVLFGKLRFYKLTLSASYIILSKTYNLAPLLFGKFLNHHLTVNTLECSGWGWVWKAPGEILSFWPRADKTPPPIRRGRKLPSEPVWFCKKTNTANSGLVITD